MNIREKLYNVERLTLSDKAVLSENTKGRKIKEAECELRTEFQRDRDRILHSDAFRRLKHKTQVFLAPKGDHYRTRLTHTLEVSQIARTISRALSLNEDLTEAIALGHDLGHTPFGHCGESVLNKLSPNGFRHYEQSVRTVEYIARNGKGLNLTYEVIDGIREHTNGVAKTLEGQAVRLADTVAYINHDIEDAISAGVISNDILPKEPIKVLGTTKSKRITTMVCSAIENSDDFIKMSDEVKGAHDELKSWLFSNVYNNPIAKGEEMKAKKLIEFLYEYYTENPDTLSPLYLEIADKFGLDRAVCDYISCMTDGYAIDTFEKLCVPKGWNK